MLPRPRPIPAVLVAHPDPAARQLLHDLIAPLGHETLFAVDAAQALLLVHNYHPPIVLASATLPDRPAHDLCRALRATRSLPYTFFTLLTDGAPDNDLGDAFAAGVDAVLPFPVDPTQLRCLLHTAARTAAAHAKFARRHAVFNRLHRRLRRANELLRAQASRDPLTNLLNRREADLHLASLIHAAHRYHQPLTAAMLDIDRFKHVNDTAGHLAGDAALRFVADTLLALTRDSDRVFRIGGDEFLLLFPHTSVDGAAPALDRFHAHLLETPLHVAGWTIRLSCSIGLAELTPDMSTPTDLLAHADANLYANKQTHPPSTQIAAA